MSENPEPKVRLGQQDWILAGFRALATGGHAAIRAEALARDLGTTKGSFYWHFKDLRQYHETMLEVWRALATTQLTAAVLRSDLGAQDRLLLLMDMVSVVPVDRVGGAGIEPAIRAWAQAEPWVQKVQAKVDAQRLSDLKALLEATGLGPPQARDGAELLYAMVIGFENLRLTQPVRMRDLLRQQAKALMAQAGRSAMR